MRKSCLFVFVATLFVLSLDIVSLQAQPINEIAVNGEEFKLLKIYGDLETDDVQPWMSLYNGRCNEKCQNEFDKCTESRATKKNCDANLYKITGVIGYEFPCGENEIWLMQFSNACKVNKAEYSGHVTCIASEVAKSCEMAGDGCAVDCKNSSKIDRDLGVYIPTATKKQHGIARPGLKSQDIRRE
jgi:hypothetical protein